MGTLAGDITIFLTISNKQEILLCIMPDVTVMYFEGDDEEFEDVDSLRYAANGRVLELMSSWGTKVSV